MIRAVISLGTNTVRLLVVRDDGESVEQLEHLQTGTRLGEGLRDGGTLSAVAVERTLAAVQRFAERARIFDAGVVCIATSVLRRADDARSFAQQVHAIAGAPLRILSGEAEAEASFRGATYGMTGEGGGVVVVDVGGGSTEVAVGTAGTLRRARSIEIGSVRLAERFPELAGSMPGKSAQATAKRARAYAAAALAPHAASGPVAPVIAVAGTATTMAAIIVGSQRDGAAGTTLSCATLDCTIEHLLNLDLEARRVLPGMEPQRADILPAGAIVLSETLRLLGAREARVQQNDLLLGYVFMTRDVRRPA